MDEKAIELIRKRSKAQDIFIVWKCKVIQNWKYIICTNHRGFLYEVTYNGDKKEWYIDVYMKVDKWLEQIKPM